MAITFDKANQIIEVEAPDTEVTIQNLLNAIRDYEEQVQNMEIYHIAEASGKEELGGSVYVGITLKLIDWKLKFEDRGGPTTVVCNVLGGNLIAYDTGTSQFVTPIEPADYVTVTVTASTSASLLYPGDFLTTAKFIALK